VRERADDSQRYGPLVRPVETLTAADFAPLRGDRFPIALDDAPAAEVELVEVTEISREPGGRAPFSLVFQAARLRRWRSASTASNTRSSGAIEMFLVPIASDRYEAVFT